MPCSTGGCQPVFNSRIGCRLRRPSTSLSIRCGSQKAASDADRWPHLALPDPHRPSHTRPARSQRCQTTAPPRVSRDQTLPPPDQHWRRDLWTGFARRFVSFSTTTHGFATRPDPGDDRYGSHLCRRQDRKRTAMTCSGRSGAHGDAFASARWISAATASPVSSSRHRLALTSYAPCFQPPSLTSVSRLPAQPAKQPPKN